MEEKIIEIIRKHYDAETKAAKEITALIESEYVEKEFVEWLPLNTMTDRVTRNKAKYMVMDMNQPAIWMTLD